MFWWRWLEQRWKVWRLKRRFDGDQKRVALFLADLGTAKVVLDLRSAIETKYLEAQRQDDRKLVIAYAAQIRLCDAILDGGNVNKLQNPD